MSEKNPPLDVVSIGDLMLDFTVAGVSEDGKMLFERNPGGAPANVAAQVAALGGASAFMGAVGEDEHGRYLIDSMERKGVCTEGIIRVKEQATRLTFVYLNSDHDRYFSSYKSPRADLLLRTENVRYDLLDRTKVIHLASSAVLEKPIAETAKNIILYAKSRKKLISYDPNWNVVFGFNRTMRQKMMHTIDLSDIVKISKEEYEFFYPDLPMEEGARRLISEGRKLVAVTMGRDGCYYAAEHSEGWLPTYAVEVKDTTGAGDSFMGGLLYQICRSEKSVEKMSGDEIRNMIAFACACGAVSSTKRGSLLVMPDHFEVMETLEKVPAVSTADSD